MNPLQRKEPRPLSKNGARINQPPEFEVTPMVTWRKRLDNRQYANLKEPPCRLSSLPSRAVVRGAVP
jgi:hypothetical protein